MTTDANEFLMGGGSTKSAVFAAYGDQVWGVVRSMTVRQQTDFKSGKPLTWDNGEPRNQLQVILQTDLREDANDDGLRAVYIRGQMQAAAKEAVKKVGVRGMAEGGRLLVRYVSDIANPDPRLNAAKQYFVKYEAPVVPIGDPLGGDADGDISADDLPF